MKVLGIVCSPRVHGNTDLLMQQCLGAAKEAGAETELISLAKMNIAPCDGCYACAKTGKCHIKDDMQEIYDRLLAADGIVFGTPVYFWTLSAQAKLVIDRCHCFMAERSLRRKAGAVLVTTRRVGGTTAYSAIASFFNLMRMQLVGGAIGFGDRELTVMNDKRAMDDAAAVGRAIVRHVQSQPPPH